jgi:hypothetical protein
MNRYFDYLNEACGILDDQNNKYPGATGRHFFVVGLSSATLFDFYIDLEKKSVKKKYFFLNSYELILAKTFIKFKKFSNYKNIYLKIKKINFEKIKKIKLFIYIFYIVKDFFFNFYVSKNKKKVDYLFLWDKYKYIDLFQSVFSKKKKSFLLLHNNNFHPENFIKKTIKISAWDKQYLGFDNLFDYNYAILKKTLLFYKPKNVIFVEGDSPIHSVLSKVCNDLKIRSICFQWGSSVWKKPKYGFRNLTCDIFLAHGKFFFDQIKSYNKKNLIKLVGNPLLNNPKKHHKKKIAIFLLQPFSSMRGDFKKTSKLFFQFMHSIISSNKDWKFIIRTHPNQDCLSDINKFNNFLNCEIINPKNITLKDSLTGCSIAFSVSSSALTDGLNYEVIPFSFNPTTILDIYQPDLNKLKIGYATKNLADAIYEANKLLIDNNKINYYAKNIIKLKNSFNYHTGKKSVKKIFKYI